MIAHVEVRPGVYRDSVALMQASRDLTALEGVSAALVAMGTDLNLDLLASMGFDRPAQAGPNDLVVALSVGDATDLDRARRALDQLLAQPDPAGKAELATREMPAARLTITALDGASLAIVSVPGRHAYVEAVDALDVGLPVMVFSDNMPIEQEVWLKGEAERRGLLVMGPDCGTAVVAGVGLGFANVVRPGPVGIVAASGSGAQQVMCLLDAAGVGVSHCLGVGGRDLTASVGGISTLRALELLDSDPATELLVIISKPADPAVAARVRDRAGRLTKPVLYGWRAGDDIAAHPDLTALATAILTALGRPAPMWARWMPAEPLPRRSGALRGLYSGGTLRDEAVGIATARLGAIAVDDLGALGHLVADFGDDRFTAGRAHPMIDPTLRAEQLRRDLANPATGVVLVDVLLGHGAHPSPAAPISEAVHAALETGDIVPPVVAALVGTTADPQNLEAQASLLVDAGVRVFLSHTEAVNAAIDLLTGEVR